MIKKPRVQTKQFFLMYAPPPICCKRLLKGPFLATPSLNQQKGAKPDNLAAICNLQATQWQLKNIPRKFLALLWQSFTNPTKEIKAGEPACQDWPPGSQTGSSLDSKNCFFFSITIHFSQAFSSQCFLSLKFENVRMQMPVKVVDGKSFLQMEQYFRNNQLHLFLHSLKTKNCPQQMRIRKCGVGRFKNPDSRFFTLNSSSEMNWCGGAN